MRIEADVNRVEALAAEKEDENWRFRQFMKWQCDLSIEEVDEAVHRLYEEVSGQIDCTECANCCRTVPLDLSRRDIERLAGHVNIPQEQLMDQYLEPSDERSMYTFRELPCPFLSGNTCTVYAARPESCRSYPHLHKDEFVSRLMQAVVNCSVCPIVYNVFERLKGELWYTQDDEWMGEDDE